MKRAESTEFHPLSIEYLNKTDLSYRKSFGQYFTPASIRMLLLSKLPKFKCPKILDPASGSGEFLLSAKEFFPGSELHGWEIDPVLVDLSRKLVPDAKIRKKDSLTKKWEPEYDFIIGNPPYFEFKPGPEIRERYRDVINGRANIFGMFIKIGLENLKDNGCLAYVIPPSMNNGAYFKKLRDYIIERADIRYLKLIESNSAFHNALQQVMILILQKRKNSGKYIFKKNGLRIFSPSPQNLKRSFKGKTTLFESGFSVKTGKIVWNENRDKLSDCAKDVTLIWAHNITENGLKTNNNSKPQYIKSNRFEFGPAIVVNRVTGTNTSNNLKAAIVKKDVRFLAENHINVIYPPAKINGKRVTEKLMKSIAGQISSPDSIHVARLITGNTQLSKNELWKLLPLKI